MEPKKPKNKGGRPRKDAKPKKPMGRKRFDGKSPDSVESKLKKAWAMGCTDIEACAFAEISVTALHECLKLNPKLSETRDRFKEKPVLQARATVCRMLKIDADLAFKYLERRKSDEFSPSMSLRHTGDIGLGNDLGKRIAASPAASAAAAKMLEALSTATPAPKEPPKDGADSSPV